MRSRDLDRLPVQLFTALRADGRDADRIRARRAQPALDSPPVAAGAWMRIDD
jgi:hypothetical protein